jgi:hypothetical protein
MSKLGDILRQIGHWIQNLLTGLPDDVKHYAGIALQVTTKLRQLVDSRAVITITELTSTIEDDAIRAAVSACLHSLEGWLEDIAEAPVKIQNAILIKIASEVTACLDGHNLKENQYDIAVQAVYSSKHKV